MKKLAFSLIFIILFTILLAGLPETLALHIAILFQWNLTVVGVMILIQEILMLFFILYLLKRADLSSIFKRKKIHNVISQLFLLYCSSFSYWQT